MGYEKVVAMSHMAASLCYTIYCVDRKEAESRWMLHVQARVDTVML